ncbi:MAG: DUF4124 domain-containing protein, partial [Thiohalobacterales bacterium]|nr:DUF4124 domain-containing protein [Thiohalobacterales bacterium]
MKAFIPLLLLLASSVQAEVYKTITPDGEVIYSDVRTRDSRQMNVPSAQTYSPPPLPAPALLPVTTDVEPELYKSFVVESPQNEATIRDNLGNVELLVTLDPELLAGDGHRIEYYLDGEPHGRRTVDTRKTYVNVDRGEHQLSAAVVDQSGKVIISTG